MQPIDVIVIKERGKYMQEKLPQPVKCLHSSLIDRRLATHASALPPCLLHLRCSGGKPQMGLVSMPGLGRQAKEFPPAPPAPSPPNHLKRPCSHAGKQGGRLGCSHQGLIRALSGLSGTDQEEEVAGRWFPDYKVVTLDCAALEALPLKFLPPLCL